MCEREYELRLRSQIHTHTHSKTSPDDTRLCVPILRCVCEAGRRPVGMCLSPASQGSAGIQVTCFTSRKVQILTQRLCGSAHMGAMAPPSMSGDERWASEHLTSEPALASVSAGSSIEPIPAYRPVGGWDAVGGVGGGDTTALCFWPADARD